VFGPGIGLDTRKRFDRRAAVRRAMKKSDATGPEGSETSQWQGV